MAWITSELAGLEPRAWACAGHGYSREELKEVLLGSGLPFISSTITTLEELALACAGTPNTLLGPSARQEVLRQLLAERRISSRLPELRALKRGGSFYRRLDDALQSARMAMAHALEERVLMERLEERLGPRSLRSEML